jgi:hypothetical protein
MEESSIWASVLRDIWSAKPRSFRPNLLGLPAARLKSMVADEIRLEKRLTSVVSPTWVRNVDVRGILEQARFVPGGGGNYVASYSDSRLELYSLDGRLLDTTPPMLNALGGSRIFLRPVAAQAANMIQISRAS